MEQFKQLKWSWHKYEEDKKCLPRNFNFEVINDNDALSRNLNEIHTCAIPKQDEYRLFKTPDEIAANSCDMESSVNVELKDPRENQFSKLKTSTAMVNDYSYPSLLKKHEQMMILRNLINDTTYNPKFLRKTAILEQNYSPIPKDLEEKWKNEVTKFIRCSEIYYYRHIKQFNNLVNNKFKEILFNKWKRIEAQFPHLKYQAITMIIRNTNVKSAFKINIEHLEDENHNIQHELYKVPDEIFPNLKDVFVESIKLFNQSKDLFDNRQNTSVDIQISLDVLTKLFVDGTEFNAVLIKDNNVNKFLLNETVPLKTISQCDALEEAIKLIMHSNIEWHNASKNIAINEDKSIDYKVFKINETMSKIFKSYKKHAGANNEISLWRLEKNSQKLLISVSRTSYFLNDETRVILSIKFEYQTKFGAEQMSKEELLNEWIQIKFSPNAIIMRYRIHVKSMDILSVIKLKIDDIEKELKDIHDCNPLDSMDILFNFFHCLNNLPDSKYLIQGQRNDKECNKLIVYKEVGENGKVLINDEEFTITESFTRKWVPIDKTVTFLHVNEELAPCCFSYKSLKRISYNAPMNKKIPKKPKVVEHKAPNKVAEKKSPQKGKVQKKRAKRKKNKATKIT